MKYRWLIMILAFLPFAVTAQDYQKAAEDHCRCFQPLNDSVSSMTKELLVKASGGDNLVDSLKLYMRALPVETQRRFKSEVDKLTLLLESDTHPRRFVHGKDGGRIPGYIY